MNQCLEKPYCHSRENGNREKFKAHRRIRVFSSPNCGCFLDPRIKSEDDTTKYKSAPAAERSRIYFGAACFISTSNANWSETNLKC